MKNKKNLILTSAVLALVIAVIGLTIALSNSGQTSNLGVSSQNVDDHHQGVGENQQVFRSLLGKKAPNFSLVDFDGKTIELEKLKGKKVVLFFTEGLMCYPSCWNQMAAFGKDGDFNNSEVITLNIAVDNKDDWKKATAQMPELASATVLFDTTRQVSSTYGVLTLPSSMHKGQFPGHTYLILDRQGIIRFTYDDPQMGVRNFEIKKELDKIN